MKIRAAVTRAPKAPASLEELRLEEPRSNEVLVRVVATGVCHTDIAMRDQAYPVPQPIVLGHEGAGVVEAVGSAVTTLQRGDHVVLSYDSCGVCESCLDRYPMYCREAFRRNFSGQRPDGTTSLSTGTERIHSHFFGQSSFATWALCMEANAVKVPKDAPLELLGPLGCGIQTGAGAVINALRVQAGDRFAVFGTGPVGLSAVMAARLVGASMIIAIDLHESRLETARSVGATHTIMSANADPVAKIMELTGSAGVNVALDTTGIPSVVRQAVGILAVRGICGIVGASPIGTQLTFDAVQLMTGGRQVRGIIGGESIPKLFIPKLLDLYSQGRFPFDRLVKFYDFNLFNEAIADSESGRVIKAIIRMSQV
jgi:aryl-alcohol dehydrogenase